MALLFSQGIQNPLSVPSSDKYLRDQQARGFVNKLAKCADCVRDYIQYVDYPFPPDQCWNDRAGVLARNSGENYILIAQVHPNMTTNVTFRSFKRSIKQFGN